MIPLYDTTVALSLANGEEIERKIDSIEKKIDTCVI